MSSVEGVKPSWKRRGSSRGSGKSKVCPRVGHGKWAPSGGRTRATTEPSMDPGNELAAVLGGRRKKIDHELSTNSTQHVGNESQEVSVEKGLGHDHRPKPSPRRNLQVTKHWAAHDTSSARSHSNKPATALKPSLCFRHSHSKNTNKSIMSSSEPACVESIKNKLQSGKAQPAPPKPKRLYSQDDSSSLSVHADINTIPSPKDIAKKFESSSKLPNKPNPPLVLPKPASNASKTSTASCLPTEAPSTSLQPSSSSVGEVRSIFEKKNIIHAATVTTQEKQVTKQKPQVLQKPVVTKLPDGTGVPHDGAAVTEVIDVASDSGNGSVVEYEDVAFSSPNGVSSEDEGWEDVEVTETKHRKVSKTHSHHLQSIKHSLYLRHSGGSCKKRSHHNVTPQGIANPLRRSSMYEYEVVDFEGWETDESGSDDYELVEPSHPIIPCSSESPVPPDKPPLPARDARLSTEGKEPPINAIKLPAVPVPTKSELLSCHGLSSSDPLLGPKIPPRRGKPSEQPLPHLKATDLSQSVPPPRPPPHSTKPSLEVNAHHHPSALPSRTSHNDQGPPVPSRLSTGHGTHHKTEAALGPPLPPRSVARKPSQASDSRHSPKGRKKSLLDSGVNLPSSPKTKRSAADLSASVPPPNISKVDANDGYLPPQPTLEAPNQGYLPMDGLDKQPSTHTPSRKVSPIHDDPQDNYIDPLTELDSLPEAPTPPPRRNPSSQVPPAHPTAPTHPPADLHGVSEESDYLILIDDMEEEEDAEEKRASMSSSRFGDEPLYQIYHTGAVARDVLEGSGEIDSDDDDYNNIYEDTDTVKSYMSNLLSRGSQGCLTDTLPREPSSLESVARVGAGVRKLWSEMVEVVESGVLEQVTTEEKKLQEGLFEVITSEASYQKSLTLLVRHFVRAAALHPSSDTCVIDKRAHHVLFSNILAVREASARYLTELESMWNTDVLIDIEAMCNLLAEFTQKHFTVYVHYCSNMIYQARMMDQLGTQHAGFKEAVKALETSEICQGLTLQSFLTLPMQRITRLPLLVDAVCHRMKPSAPHYALAQGCFSALQKLVRQCNEGARQMSNIEQVTNIDKMLKFKSVKKIALVSQSRSLVKKGALCRLQKQASGLLDKFKKKEYLHLFLFNDLLLITKKKSEEEFQVIEHSSRISVHAEVINDEDVPKMLPHLRGTHNLLTMVLLEKNQEYLLACDSMSERMRWVEAVTPAQQTSDDEHIYDEWHCPQVQALFRYVADEPDELSLEESDVINVFRKMADGWYEGERIRDGERGWFPSNHVVEIQSAHIRAKNLRQRYRMQQQPLAGGGHRRA